jgi:hypothetical protein
LRAAPPSRAKRDRANIERMRSLFPLVLIALSLPHHATAAAPRTGRRTEPNKTTPRATPSPSPRPVTREVKVKTSEELAAALADAKPGDTITLAARTYSGSFEAKTSGTAERRIRLVGPPEAILDGGDPGFDTTFAFHLTGRFWTLEGFTLVGADKGLMLDGASDNVIDHLTVRGTGTEGVHFRAFSSRNVLKNSRVFDTGKRTPGFGEGVYIGSASGSNWAKVTGGEPDRCDENQVLDNHIGPDVRAEGLDIKEGTAGGVVRGNTFDATGIRGENFADSFVDVKGNGYTIEGNTGVNPRGAGALKNGIEITHVLDGWGTGNTLRRNTLDLGGAPGFGIEVKKGSVGNVVCSDNEATRAGKGLANVPLTDCPGQR